MQTSNLNHSSIEDKFSLEKAMWSRPNYGSASSSDDLILLAYERIVVCGAWNFFGKKLDPNWYAAVKDEVTQLRLTQNSDCATRLRGLLEPVQNDELWLAELTDDKRDKLLGSQKWADVEEVVQEAWDELMPEQPDDIRLTISKKQPEDTQEAANSDCAVQ